MGPTRISRFAIDAMGTRFELVIASAEPLCAVPAAEAALESIEDLDRRLSWFSRASVLSRINGLAAEGPVGVDREVFDLLRTCREVWLASEGAFDPTIAPLMRAWGFRGGETDPGAVDEARQATGMHLVELDEGALTVRYARPGVSIDLGAIAKGYALEAAAVMLRGAGVDCAVLHGGTSSVVAIGSPPGEEGWPIRVFDDRTPIDLRLRDWALGVSAPRGRMLASGAGHVLDPRSGSPVSRAVCAAVTGPSAMLADAWSTAALVLGAVPRGLPDGYCAWVRPQSGAGVEKPWIRSELRSGGRESGWQAGLLAGILEAHDAPTKTEIEG